MGRTITERRGRLVKNREVDVVCDVGQKGREIIASTGFLSQSDYNPRRGRRVANMLNDVFHKSHFAGKRILELGPGHYAFALLARHLGAEVVCVERDPAFVQLGRHLGFEVLDQDFNALDPSQFKTLFDGLWVKGTFNSCNPASDEGVAEFVNRITRLLKPDAWGWFVTVNKTERAPSGWEIQKFVDHRVEVQRAAFVESGWRAWRLPEEQRPRYSLNYSNSRYIFTRMLRLDELELMSAPKVTIPVRQGAQGVEDSNQPGATFIVSGNEDEADQTNPNANKRFNAAFRAWQPHPAYLDNPWEHFKRFIDIAKRRGAHFITMSQARAGKYNKSKINVLLDHHIDFYPVETEVMCRWELENDVVSSVYLFNRVGCAHVIQRKVWKLEDLNIPFYQQLEQAGFEIGYHQNAVGTARFERTGNRWSNRNERDSVPEVDIRRATEIFAEDVRNLRRYFNIRTFIPHGAGEQNHQLLDLPEGFDDIAWVYNNAKRNKSTKSPIKWRNFSDSSGVRPQPVHAYGARYLMHIDNLNLNAYLLQPGLNHVLVHPGRFSRGMPYQFFGEPEKLNDLCFEQLDFLPDRTLSIHELPLATSDLIPAWEGKEIQAKREVAWSKRPDYYTIEQSEKLYYLFSDDVGVLRQHMAINRLCVPFLVIHENLSGEEMRERLLPPQSVDPKVRRFHIPVGRADADTDEAFIEEFDQFINRVFTGDIAAHLYKSRLPVGILHLTNLNISTRTQAMFLQKLLTHWPEGSVLHIKVGFKMPESIWRKYMKPGWWSKRAWQRFNIRYGNNEVVICC